jgi:hypothetical protein
MVVCLATAHSPGTLNIAISFDGVGWSAEMIQFVYRKRLGIQEILPLGCIYASVVAGVAAILWIGAKKGAGITHRRAAVHRRGLS